MEVGTTPLSPREHLLDEVHVILGDVSTSAPNINCGSPRETKPSKVGAKGWVGDDDIYGILLIYPEFLGVLKDFSRDLMIKRVG